LLNNPRVCSVAESNGLLKGTGKLTVLSIVSSLQQLSVLARRLSLKNASLTGLLKALATTLVCPPLAHLHAAAIGVMLFHIFSCLDLYSSLATFYIDGIVSFLVMGKEANNYESSWGFQHRFGILSCLPVTFPFEFRGFLAV
jgi:hypothetical protein